LASAVIPEFKAIEHDKTLNTMSKKSLFFNAPHLIFDFSPKYPCHTWWQHAIPHKKSDCKIIVSSRFSFLTLISILV
jgi:hypothetical protein